MVVAHLPAGQRKPTGSADRGKARRGALRPRAASSLAQLLDGLDKVVGVTVDRTTGSIIFFGRRGEALDLPPLRVDDVVTIFRSVYLHGQAPTVTIDPVPGDPRGDTMVVEHGPGTAATYVGWLLYQCDRVMKSYLMTKDNITGEKIVTVNDAEYTTCNPGSEAWMLNAEELELDFSEDVGTAQNVWFELGGVPVFYTPYATFPLSNKRKSGLLVPKVRIANSTGFDLTVPYYFNIAPNQDATLAGRLMTKRGLQLQGEYRYLTRLGGGLVAGRRCQQLGPKRQRGEQKRGSEREGGRSHTREPTHRRRDCQGDDPRDTSRRRRQARQALDVSRRSRMAHRSSAKARSAWAPSERR